MREPSLKTVSIYDTIDILGHKIKGFEALRNAVNASSSHGNDKNKRNGHRNSG